MKKIMLLVLAAVPAMSAFAAPCAPGESKVVVRQDTVGAINLDEYKAIDFKSPESTSNAVKTHVARAIAAGTVACRKSGSFFDYAAVLNLPGQPLDLWVPDSTLEKAE
jgi:hypothetical protein